MPESDTPICDLIERLLSTQMSTSEIFEIARPTEKTLLRATTGRASTPEKRQQWAGQKKRQRGMSTVGLDSKNNKDSIGKEEKNPGVDISPDGWPADFVGIFWREFPPYRRQARDKVGTKLARIRAEGKVSWETLIGGVRKFAATNPGEYAPAPMVWLNDGRWDREYGPRNSGGSNGKTQTAGVSANVGFAGRAAEARARIAERFGDPERPAPEDLQPVNGR